MKNTESETVLSTTEQGLGNTERMVVGGMGC